jgi:hypothetical protein
MLRRIATVALVLGLIATPTVFGQKPNDKEKAPEALKWKLERLNHDPFRLIKATPDPEKGQVRFVVELTQDPGTIDVYKWTHGSAPAVFRFLDEDGVAIKTVEPKVEGELIPQKGARLRLVLPMPDEKTLEKTQAVVAY